MPNKSLVVRFLFAFVLSAGMLQAQPAEEAQEASAQVAVASTTAASAGTTPEYVYSTEVTPSVYPGEHTLAVTAVFQVTPSTGKWTKQLVLEKYWAYQYGHEWLRGLFPSTATFGQGDGFTYQWGMTGTKEVATFTYLRPGVYRLSDGTTQAVVMVGTPNADQIPDLSANSHMLYSRLDGNQLSVFTQNVHNTYIMAWQATGTRVALGFQALLLTTPIGQFTLGETRNLQSEPLNVVVYDTVTGVSSATQVSVRDPFAGQGAKK